MKRLVLLIASIVAALMVAMTASGQSPDAPASDATLASNCTAYYVSGSCVSPTYGSITSNGWKLSGSYARRTNHYMQTTTCLPSWAQLQVANFDQSGAMINTHRSAPGFCGVFQYPLTSNGLYAKAGCRIISSGGAVTRTVACMTEWY